MKAGTCGECGSRERTGFMREGECRDCRDDSTGKPEPSNHRTRTSNPHAEQASRHRVISNTVGRDL